MDVNVSPDRSEIPLELWPLEWSNEQWREKKAKYPWLISSKAHTTAFNVATEKETNSLIKNFEDTENKINKSTHLVFRTVDLVELSNQTVENIVQQLIKCLHHAGFNDHWHSLNHRLELAVHDSIKDIGALNHFKSFIDSLYVLYNASPKNQNELRNVCNELDILFLKLGRVLDVRWVASSWRAINVVWKTFPALCNHFCNAANDSTKDSKTRNKYLGLKKRLASPEFLSDLGLMCDCLQELSTLSNQLQERTTTLIQGQKHIQRTIRIIESFKVIPGEHKSEVSKLKEVMVFKNIQLSTNSKLITINPKQFISSITNNLKHRLLENSSEETIIQDLLVMDISIWPENTNIRHAENEMKRICKRFLLYEQNAINGIRQLTEDNTLLPKKVMPEVYNLCKTYPISTAEYERGFSVMNNICTKLRARLTMVNIANLMFININGPPLDNWNPEYYVKTWLVHHGTAEDSRTKPTQPNKHKVQEDKMSLWKILCYQSAVNICLEFVTF
ncbi:E3 SUMO-protein ligase KIAA1586-like [Aphis craccivora]|uniref:E3 SUMO-protein ligase KIAA1586-like n=1 Tax=Aphis craccivora TaxID=307492 RepID=A0A6G0YEY4_APHCR|nr:E3 SUMO-protein ligase KIAA1586-like [Aphis craccivora]